MRGYWGNPEANRAAFTADGYFRTGDMGVFDAEGRLKIVDRKKDMILVSGFNVYPNEVEAVASAHPAVLESAAIAMPDEHSGEVVVLVVVMRMNSALTEATLIEYCRQSLTGYKVPKRVYFKNELPKSN